MHTFNYVTSKNDFVIITVILFVFWWLLHINSADYQVYNIYSAFTASLQ